MIPNSQPAGDTNTSSLAFVFTGGGARAAYQVGFLRHLATHYPNLAPEILTGVSAGAMIAMHLASRRGPFVESVARLTQIWQNLRIDDICRVSSVALASRVTRWGLRLLCGCAGDGARGRSLINTDPLRQLLMRTLEAGPDGTLDRITRNLEAGVLRSVALTASSSMTGQSVTWMQSHNQFSALLGDGARRETIDGSLRVDHVMASGALPFIFPAIKIEGGWYGDGGMRLTAPLSPAIRLGARKIIAVSTRHSSSEETCPPIEMADTRPPRVAGALLNAIFLDLLDANARRLQHVNSLIDRLPPERRGRLQHVDVLVLRPSQDLGQLANEFEADLPRGLRFLLRRVGIGETRSNDLVSLLMFQRDYISRLIDLGEADARLRAPEIAAFMQSGFRRERPHGRPGLIANLDETTSGLTKSSLLDTSVLTSFAN